MKTTNLAKEQKQRREARLKAYTEKTTPILFYKGVPVRKGELSKVVAQVKDAEFLKGAVIHDDRAKPFTDKSEWKDMPQTERVSLFLRLFGKQGLHFLQICDADNNAAKFTADELKSKAPSQYKEEYEAKFSGV